MKFPLLVAILLVLILSAVQSVPADGAAELENRESQDRGGAIRQRRVTCDLLSFLGDSACAANCLSMEKAGGHCSGGICICRRDTFKEVWNERMKEPEEMKANRKKMVEDLLERHKLSSQSG